MMLEKTLYFIFIYLVGEFIFNFTLFRYLKDYFKVDSLVDSETKKFMFFKISTFKGLQERLILFFALVNGLPQILIVYGALKIGTRFEKNEKIKNDYFLVGNFFSIGIAVLYNMIYHTFY